MELERKIVKRMKCEACGQPACRTLVTVRPGKTRKARVPACTICYNRHRRGRSGFWSTWKSKQSRRDRQRADAKQMKREGYSMREIAESLSVSVSTARNRIAGR